MKNYRRRFKRIDFSTYLRRRRKRRLADREEVIQDLTDIYNLFPVLGEKHVNAFLRELERDIGWGEDEKHHLHLVQMQKIAAARSNWRNNLYVTERLESIYTPETVIHPTFRSGSIDNRAPRIGKRARLRKEGKERLIEWGLMLKWGSKRRSAIHILYSPDGQERMVLKKRGARFEFLHEGRWLRLETYDYMKGGMPLDGKRRAEQREQIIERRKGERNDNQN